MKAVIPSIEPLESRIAPAAIVTYADVDGDLVKITASKGPLDLGDLTLASGQLRSLNLTDPLFSGANLTFTVTQKPGGDGLAHVGVINATGVDLGNVTVKGDLGSIDAGDATFTTQAVKTLTTRSVGAFNLALGNSLQSDLVGGLGVLKVAGDFVGAYLNVTNGGIGSIEIGGSLSATPQDHSGAIIATGNIGPVKVGGDVIGGPGTLSGIVMSSFGKVGTVNIGGSIRGGDAAKTGAIISNSTMGAVTIGADILGGRGSESGVILANGGLASITVNGSVLALPGVSVGVDSAKIFSGGPVSLVKIVHDVRGGDGANAGLISATGVIANVQIGGSLVGGSEPQSGAVHSATKLTSVSVAGDLRGGIGANAGAIFTTGTGEIGNVAIGGSVVGALRFGANTFSASITSATKIGTVRIHGDFYLGEVTAGGTSDIASISIGGWTYYGNIETQGDIGTLKIGRDLRGGAVTVGGDLTTLSIGRSFIGETEVFGRTIGDPLPRGIISVGGTLGTTTIGGDIRGGDSSDSAYLTADRFGSVTIGGSIVSGVDRDLATDLTHNASIRAGHDIRSITVRGSILGNDFGSGVSRPVISALGQGEASGRASDVAIGSLTVGSRVLHALVLAGYAPDDAPGNGSNGDASINTIRVGGDWIASSAVAGIQDAAADGFANGDDYVIPGSSGTIISRIASITIGGAVIGTKTSPGDQFGFTAQQIGFFKAGLYTAPLTAATDAPILLTPLTGDVFLREVL